LLLAFSFQTILYCVVGKSVVAGMTYTSIFPLFLTQTFSSLSSYLIPLFSLFIGCSALGGAYGILYSNMWNLYTIGENNTFVGSKLITTCLSSGIPLYCIIAEGIGCFFYLILTQGAQLPLQMIATIGSVIVYAICMIVLFKREQSLLSCLGIFCATLLLTISFYRFLWI